MARDRNKPEGVEASEGVVIDQPAAEKPAAPKPKNTGDPELKAIGRLTRHLATLSPKAQRRVGRYLADWLEAQAEVAAGDK